MPATHGERIRKLMRQRGLSQTELAHACRMHPSHLSTFLSGKADIGTSRFLRILEVLGVDPWASSECADSVSGKTSEQPSGHATSTAKTPSNLFLMASGLPVSEREALLIFTQRMVREQRRGCS